MNFSSRSPISRSPSNPISDEENNKQRSLTRQPGLCDLTLQDNALLSTSIQMQNVTIDQDALIQDLNCIGIIPEHNIRYNRDSSIESYMSSRKAEHLL